MLFIDNLMFMAMEMKIWSSKDQCVIQFLRVNKIQVQLIQMYSDGVMSVQYVRKWSRIKKWLTHIHDNN
jgi:hypothetical protein